MSKDQRGETAIVQIRYWHLVEEDLVTHSKSVIAADEYEQPRATLVCSQFGPCEGALWNRDEVCFTGISYETIFNSSVAGGVLQIDAALTPNKHIHWWFQQRIPVKQGKRYSIELEYKIIGKAALQVGADYWRDLTIGYNMPQNNDCTNGSNNCEAWNSVWLGDTQGVFKIKSLPIYP